MDFLTGILYCAESSGADDGYRHRGPQFSEKVWNGIAGSPGVHHVQLDKSGQVLFVRPPPNFGQARAWSDIAPAGPPAPHRLSIPAPRLTRDESVHQPLHLASCE